MTRPQLRQETGLKKQAVDDIIRKLRERDENGARELRVAVWVSRPEGGKLLAGYQLSGDPDTPYPGRKPRSLTNRENYERIKARRLAAVTPGPAPGADLAAAWHSTPARSVA